MAVQEVTKEVNGEVVQHQSHVDPGTISGVFIHLFHEDGESLDKNGLKTNDCLGSKGVGKHLALGLMLSFDAGVGKVSMDTGASVIPGLLEHIGTVPIHLIRCPGVEDRDVVGRNADMSAQALVGIIYCRIVIVVKVMPDTPEGGECGDRWRRELSEAIRIPQVSNYWKDQETQDGEGQRVWKKEEEHCDLCKK